MTDLLVNISLREAFGNYTPQFPETISSEDISAEIIVLACVYTVVFGVGIFGNGSLLTALLSQHSARVRNPLLVGLCIADLLVCACSGPLAAAKPTLALNYEKEPCEAALCTLLTCLECFPVSASTLSLMMLSVDRYVTVQHPRTLAGLQKRPLVMSVVIWVVAGILMVPQLLARYYASESHCQSDCFLLDVRTACIISYVFLVYVVPTTTMMICHLSVRSKLCALSLTARAAHGELPLPMPLLRRPTHVIIVAGMANNAQTQAVTYGCDIEDGRGRDSRKSRKQPSGGPQRGSSQRRSNKIDGPSKPSLLTTQPQTSTLQSRRRLANVLVSVAAVFAGCWLPHAISCIYAEFYKNAPKYVFQYSLLLGHAHSAINPVVYWALNHQTLRQQGCWPCPRAHRFLFHFKFHEDQPPSSTNEAALGPFHPRYTRARPVIERAAPSSHYLY